MLLASSLLLAFANARTLPRWSKTCQLCDIPFDSNAKSSERDVIVMMIAKKIGRIGLCVRSLRSTGCRARIIIFVDAALLPTEDFVKITDECGCEVKFVKLTAEERKSPHLSRFVVYNNWLTKHHKELDRIMHIDAFDTFFQRDPFEYGVSSEGLDVVLEDKRIRDCPWNSRWIEGCYGKKELAKVKDGIIACSGSIAGSATHFLKFLQVLLNSPKWSKCWQPSIDQAHFNYLLYSGAYMKANIPIHYHNCNSSFLTMTYCSRNSRDLDHRGLLLSPNGSNPSFIHQYNRFEEMIYHYERLCS